MPAKGDAATFAAWGVDYVKLDGCYSEPSTMETGYPEFGRYLNLTGRPMVYSCSWPAYQIGHNPDYKVAPLLAVGLTAKDTCCSPSLSIATCGETSMTFPILGNPSSA